MSLPPENVAVGLSASPRRRCAGGRGVAVEPEPVGLELADHVGELFEQPVGVAAADVGEVGLRVGLAVRPDAEPVGVGLHERRVADRHLDRADVEDRLGPGLVALLDVGAEVPLGLLHLLRRVQRRRRADGVPPAQGVEDDHVVTGLQELGRHRRAAGQVADPEVGAGPLRDRPGRDRLGDRPGREARDPSSGFETSPATGR